MTSCEEIKDCVPLLVRGGFGIKVKRKWDAFMLGKLINAWYVTSCL